MFYLSIDHLRLKININNKHILTSDCLIVCRFEKKYQLTNLFDSIQQPLQEVLSLGITLLSFCRW